MTHLGATPLTLNRGGRQLLDKAVDFVDPDFFSIIRLPFVAGDRRTALSQPESVVLTEAAARKFFGNRDPMDRTLTANMGGCPAHDAACRGETVSLRVTGVIGDLPQNTQLTGDLSIPTASLADLISPQGRQAWLDVAPLTYVTLAPGKAQVTLNQLPAGRTTRGHTALRSWRGGCCPRRAPMIACLGLYGLVLFTAERRTKEVAVRKISGASTLDIVRVMLKRISLPVVLANVIAWPVTYYYLNRWLDGFADHIRLDPAYFVAGGLVALLIAWATVFAHTLRLARTGPVHALRYE